MTHIRQILLLSLLTQATAFAQVDSTAYSQTMATALGTTELVLALKDENELIEKLPTGYLDATIGIAFEDKLGNTKTTRIIKCSVDAFENIITFKWKNIETGSQIISNSINILNITKDADGINEEIYNSSDE